MGRNAKSVALHLAEGNPNRLTKAEIEARKQSEIKLGKSDLDKLQPPPFVKNDAVAFKYWKQLLTEYKSAAKQGIELLSSSDVGALSLYCKTYSEYESLLKYKDLYDTDIENIDNVLKLESAINKKMDMLIKMQDRLFLNSLAKVKNVPKREKEKPDNPLESEYGI
jgi:phage terminase small subunit